MGSVSIDYNRRRDPLLTPEIESDKTSIRVLQAAIPFLSLYQPAALGVSAVSGGLQIYTSLSHFKEAYQKGDRKEMSEAGMKGMLIAASLALLLFRPKSALALTHSYALMVEGKDFAKHIWKKEHPEACQKAMKMATMLLFVAAEFYRLPELKAASLVVTALKEVYDSHAEYQKGRYIETFSKLFLALIRSYQSKTHLSRAYRKHFGRELTQEDWNAIVKEVDSHVQKELVKPRGRGNGAPPRAFYRLRPVTQGVWDAFLDKISWNNRSDIETYLIEGNFSNRLSHLDISDQDLMGIHIHDVDFIECDFNQADLNQSEFSSVRFENCTMKKVSMIGAKLQDLVFLSCDLEKAVFYLAQGKRVSFIDSNLIGASFNDGTWNYLYIIASRITRANFFGAQVTNSLMESCDLTNVLLAGTSTQFSFKDCTPAKITKLVIGLGWGFEEGGGYAGGVEEALEDQDVLVMRYEYSSPHLDEDGLRREIDLKLEETCQKGFSIGDRLLHYTVETKEFEKAKKLAEEILHYSDGLIIPGGDDVERDLYSSEAFDRDYGTDYRRSILEYALISLCHKRKMPLMGHCRGLQIANAYFGGTIKDVEDQFDRIQKLDFSPTPGGHFMRKMVGGDIYGISLHEQAADQVANELEVALTVDEEGGVVKALVSRDRLIILTQFHPESYSEVKKIMKKYHDGDEEALEDIRREAFWELSDEQREQLIRIGRSSAEKVKALFEGHVLEYLSKCQKCLPGEKFYQYFLGRVQEYKNRFKKVGSDAAPAA